MFWVTRCIEKCVVDNDRLEKSQRYLDGFDTEM